MIEIAQCNNALVFPGIGLGVLAVGAKRLSKNMIWAASQALGELSPSKKDSFLPLLPSLDQAQTVAKDIARAVAKAAIEENLATHKDQSGLHQIPQLSKSFQKISVACSTEYFPEHFLKLSMSERF